MQNDMQDAEMDGQEEQAQDAEYGEQTSTTGDELVNEIGRLGRKFVEVLETAWNSEQRLEIQDELRKGLNNVAGSLESGIKEVSEKEETQEVIGKAEEVADEVVDRVRTSEFANELAAGLSSGLHTLGDQLDKIASDIRSGKHNSTDQGPSADSGDGQDIPITDEDE